MTTFFRYPGGKSKLSDTIISRLKEMCPSPTVYREPFFGGGSIGIQVLDSFSVENVWLNDLDIGIYCLWKSVVSYPNEFKELIRQFTPSVDSFYNFRSDLLSLKKSPTIETEIVQIGFKKLVTHQISYSGLGTKSGGPLGGADQKSKYKINCRWNGNRLIKKVDALNLKLKNVNITCLDFESLLSEKMPNGTLIYLDPPYFLKGNVLYQFGFCESDHVRLAALLKQCKTPWLLSYDDCDEIRDLYSWAKQDVIGINYTITSSRKKNELLIQSV